MLLFSHLSALLRVGFLGGAGLIFYVSSPPAFLASPSLALPLGSSAVSVRDHWHDRLSKMVITSEMYETAFLTK